MQQGQFLLVKLANGRVVRTNSVVSVNCVLSSDLVHTVQCYVIEGLTCNVVLGIPWLKEHNPKIDWRTGSVQFIDDMEQVHYCQGIGSAGIETQAKVELCGMKACLKASRRRSTAGAWFALLRGSDSDLFGIKNDQDPIPSNIQSVLDSYQDVFGEPQEVVQREVKHSIELKDENEPVPRQKIYRMSQPELAEVRKQLDEYLAKGWIRPSSSPYGHPILFVRKKTGELRMCIDFRTLNQNTRLDAYPIPRIDTLLDSLSGANVFSILDLRSGYHQVPMEPGHEFKTAFTSQWGLFEFMVMPFGLCNAPATFQRLMNSVLRDGLGHFVSVYLDDILIFSKDVESHEEHLKWVLSQLRAHKLYAKMSKCEFAVPEIQYLGHRVSSGRIAMDPEKVKAIKEWPPPTSQKELQQFLGLANYYNKFISNFATIAAPLSDMTGKKVQFQWTQAASDAFDALREALCSADVLRMPDFSKDFVIETDASDRGIGAVLEQDFGHGLQPIAFFSRKFQAAELNYPVHERELLAIVLAVQRWRHYLDGKETVILTDHAPLVHIFTQPQLSKRQTRWMEKLSEFHLDIKYRAGLEAVVPDALSRIYTLVCEPGWLARVARAQVDVNNEEMATVRTQASGKDARFVYRRQGDLQLIYRVTPDGERLVIPSTAGLRDLLVSELHDSLLSGHLGARKTFLALAQRVWWNRMESWIRDWVQQCPVCQQSKDRTTLSPGSLQPLPIPENRFECWSMDFITNLPKSNGYNAIFTCVERLTKLIRITPCSMGEGGLRATEIARLFFDNVVRHFGVPKVIVSDRDPRFTGAFWQALMSILGTKLTFSTAHHPQTDGQTERAHRVIEQVLRSYCVATGTTTGWDKLLAHAEFAINSTPSASTKVSPFMLVYGQSVAQPTDHLDGAHFVQSSQDTVNRVKYLVEEAKKNLQQAQEYQKRYFDKKHKDITFKVGDQVLLSTKHLDIELGKKLGNRWIGPFKVVERIGQQAYRLELSDLYSTLHDVFHVSLLRIYNVPGIERAQPQGMPVLTDQGVEFEVFRILRHRRKRGRGKTNQFLVQWKGYPLSDATWEDEDALQNAPEKLREYWNSQSN